MSEAVRGWGQKHTGRRETDCAYLQPSAMEKNLGTPSFNYNVVKETWMQGCCPYGYMLVLAKGCIRKKNPKKLLSVAFGCLGYSEQNVDLKYEKKNEGDQYVLQQQQSLYTYSADECWWMDIEPIWVVILPCKSMVISRGVTYSYQWESILLSSNIYTTASYACLHEYGQMYLHGWGVYLERWNMRNHYNHMYFGAKWKQKTI